jgi:hypothetical protein
MYRDTEEGKDAVPPAQLAMAILLQAYTGSSDAEAIENAVVDARWRMVLGVLGHQTSRTRRSRKGTLQRFRRAHDRARHGPATARDEPSSSRSSTKRLRLQEAAQGRAPRGRLSPASPARGEVEDTFNLLGPRSPRTSSGAQRPSRRCKPDELAEADRRARAGREQHQARPRHRLERPRPEGRRHQEARRRRSTGFEAWVREEARAMPRSGLPLSAATRDARTASRAGPRARPRGRRAARASWRRPRSTDLHHRPRHAPRPQEQEPDDQGLQDPPRAPTSTATSWSRALSLPANKPEADALPAILRDLAQHRGRNTIGSLHIDRGYLASEAVREISPTRACPSSPSRGAHRTGPLYGKSDFKLHLGHRTITCHCRPHREDPARAPPCTSPQRSATHARSARSARTPRSGRGRAVTIAL